MKEELVLAKETAVARGQPLAIENFESVLRYAIEKGVSLQDIVAVRRELKAEADKAAFDAAMAQFQAEMPVVYKTKPVMSGVDKLYSYAAFEDVIAVAKPYMQKHGFSFTLDTDVESKDGWVIAKCRVVHSAGHSETSSVKLPIGAGTRAMSTTQIFAAALSFASRRAFCAAFGIVCAGEDAEGQLKKPKPAGPSTLAADLSVKEYSSQLWTLLKPVRGEQRNWVQANQFMVDEMIITPDESAPNFSVARFKEVIERAKKRLAELGKSL